MVNLFRILNIFFEQMLILEQSCILCGLQSPAQICQDCFSSLQSQQNLPHCPRCLIALAPKEIRCQNCQKHNFYFDRIIAAYHYRPPLSKILYQLKYHGKLEYSTLLSKLFWNAISKKIDYLPDVIIPVPLHPNKHKLRGFNQVNEILREFQQSNPEIARLNITRIKDTQTQAKLNQPQRILNVYQAFSFKETLDGLHVAVVDDVVTTASTVNEIARLCVEQGASKIDIWCLMRAQD